MQVSCPECATEYEFESSAIPAEGYDAQCTSCNAIFFVKPELEGDVPQDSVPEQIDEDEVSATCPHCHTVYQFASSDIPEAGYDAQCTECDGIFFVSPAMPAEPMNVQGAQTLGTSLDVNQAESNSTAGNAAGESLEEASDLPEEPLPDMLSLSMQLGEPAASPDGVSAEDDFEEIVVRRNRRYQYVGIGVAIVVGLNLFAYIALPQVFDATVGPLIGIKAAINPDAIPLVEKANVAIFLDTSSGYEEALSVLENAIELDGQYPEAIAYKGLAHVFKGTDLQAKGRIVTNDGIAAAEALKLLQKTPSRKRPKGYTKRVKMLRTRIVESNKSAKPYFEQGGQEIARGLELLKGAAKQYPDSPMVVLGYGIYKATDSDSASSAKSYLKHVLAQLQGGDDKLHLDQIKNPWTAYLQGRILLHDPFNLKQAPAAFRAALKVKPTLNRARYDLALALEKLGQLDESIAVAKELLTMTSNHEKAKDLVERLEAQKKEQNRLAKKNKPKNRGKASAR